MKRNNKAICATCPFWSEPKREAAFGLCRQHAPRGLAWNLSVNGDDTELENTEGTSNDFAPTQRNDWCANHPEFWVKDTE